MRALTLKLAWGRILDGMESPWVLGKLVVDGGEIAVIRNVAAAADHVIDVAGCVVAPGFVDVHTHSDFTRPANRNANSKVRQGVTLPVVGNFGISAGLCRGDAARTENLRPIPVCQAT